jgi:hypothetical protein
MHWVMKKLILLIIRDFNDKVDFRYGSCVIDFAWGQSASGAGITGNQSLDYRRDVSGSV